MNTLNSNTSFSVTILLYHIESGYLASEFSQAVSDVTSISESSRAEPFQKGIDPPGQPAGLRRRTSRSPEDRRSVPAEYSLSFQQIQYQGYNIYQHCQDNAEHNHGCDWDKNFASLGLNMDITRQFAKPVNQPGGKVEYHPENE
jgi:hypothetical protein